MQADADSQKPTESPDDPIDATAAEAPAALDPWEELEAEAAKWKEISSADQIYRNKSAEFP